MLPCEDASVPATMETSQVVLGCARQNARVVTCGNATGTVRKSFVFVQFNNSSLNMPFEKFDRTSATVECVRELNSYAFDVRLKSGLFDVEELRLKVVLSA